MVKRTQKLRLLEVWCMVFSDFFQWFAIWPITILNQKGVHYDYICCKMTICLSIDSLSPGVLGIDSNLGLAHGRQILCYRATFPALITVLWTRRRSLEPKERVFKETMSSKSGFLQRSWKNKNPWQWTVFFTVVFAWVIILSHKTRNLNPTSKLAELPTAKAVHLS